MTAQSYATVISLGAQAGSPTYPGTYPYPASATALDLDRTALWNSPGSFAAQRIGPTITAAATIAPTYPVHHVSGAGPLVTITVPWVGFNGQIILIADGALTWTAAGNIQTASSAALTAGTQLLLTYDNKAGKWQPSKLTT